MDYLPLFPPAIRDQALRLLAQLLDHDRSIEKASAGKSGNSQ